MPDNFDFFDLVDQVEREAELRAELQEEETSPAAEEELA